MHCGHQSRPAVGKILPLHLIQTTFFPLEKSDLANLLKFFFSTADHPIKPGDFQICRQNSDKDAEK
jgi:poly(3-hydroxyalkanoate) synthetase